jgi:YheO-like PAS domain.
MNDPNKSIVYIANGQVTNRNIGDKFKILGGKDIDKFLVEPILSIAKL